MRSRMSKLECSPLHQVFPLKRHHLPLRDEKRAACLDQDNSESVIDLKKKTFRECSNFNNYVRKKFIESMIKYMCAFMKVDSLA